jgi:hypothetical protein
MPGLHCGAPRRVVDTHTIVVDGEDEPIVLQLDHDPDHGWLRVLDGVDHQLLGNRHE